MPSYEIQIKAMAPVFADVFVIADSVEDAEAQVQEQIDKDPEALLNQVFSFERSFETFEPEIIGSRLYRRPARSKKPYNRIIPK